MNPSEAHQSAFLDLVRGVGAPTEGIVSAGVMARSFNGKPIMLVWGHTLNLAASANALADFIKQGGTVDDLAKLAGVSTILRAAADQFEAVLKAEGN